MSRPTGAGVERTWAYRAAALTAVAPMRLLTETDWQGLEHLPRGGCVVAVNHLCYVDPFAVAHLLYDNGHPPFFLAKEALFRIPLFGRWLAAAGQVPVYRETDRAVDAYAAAVTAVRAGRTVVIMPEGTVTRDPDLWPMRGKSGAVRIAREAGVPLVPLGQWGATDLMAQGSTRLRPSPRATMHMRFGPPIDLSDVAELEGGHVLTRETLEGAADRMMRAITREVAHLRGEPAPAGLWDRRLGRRITTQDEGERP